MKLVKIKDIVKADVVWGEFLLNREINEACGADLMSDVLAFSMGPSSLLLTGLVNPQVMRTAEMVDLSAILFVRGKRPPEATIAIAKQARIPILCTEHTLYKACGLLYSAGLIGSATGGQCGSV